ncbi:MAG: DNA polymerase-3 subunit epsilon [Psychromonas sp.]|jgi:DNA polymerase-3 subunit epsilon|uniref:3'-5' exonuclease n=1 Tax=Psychromonas sp. TaxID=1884585 RepID=UPI0039E4C1C4
MSDANNIVIFDFETTGLSPKMGDRAIEIGAVRIKNGLLVDRFQALMNPGMRINSFIENFTGISNKMLAEAEPCAVVMDSFCDFIGSDNLVAHNASFDKNFLDAELHRISRRYPGQISCSMLLARRLLRDAPNHKLGTLVDYLNIQTEGGYHRALFDSEMTAKVWLTMINKIQQRYNMARVPFALVQKLCKTPAASAHRTLTNWK